MSAIHDGTLIPRGRAAGGRCTAQPHHPALAKELQTPAAACRPSAVTSPKRTGICAYRPEEKTGADFGGFYRPEIKTGRPEEKKLGRGPVNSGLPP
eukprot:gene14176-biopygen18617